LAQLDTLGPQASTKIKCRTGAFGLHLVNPKNSRNGKIRSAHRPARVRQNVRDVLTSNAGNTKDGRPVSKVQPFGGHGLGHGPLDPKAQAGPQYLLPFVTGTLRAPSTTSSMPDNASPAVVG